MTDASSLALCGIPVFPCNSLKRPAVEGGFHSATLSPPADWNYPLIGIPIPSETVIFDLDTHKGISTDAIERVLGQSLDWLSAKLQDTPSGGSHYAFSLPPGVSVRQSVNWFKDQIGEGFDTRTSGRGYICTGSTYRQEGVGVIKLTNPDSLPDLPESVIEKLQPPTIDPAKQVIPQGDRDIDEVVKVLSHIDPSCDYVEWRNAAMAIKHYFHDDPATGKAILTDWSQKSSDKFDPSALELLWGSISPTNANGQASVTMGTLVNMARKNGYKPPAKLDAGEVFGTVRASNDSFTDLINRINAQAGQPGALDQLSTEIRTGSLSPMQRQEACAVLFRSLSDHGLKVVQKDVRDACTPSKQERIAPGMHPVPQVVEFIDIPVCQIDGLSGNHGQSAVFVYDSVLKGRMVKYGHRSVFWWTGQQWQAVSEEDLTDLVSRCYGQGEYAKRANVTATAKTIISNLPRVPTIGAPDSRLFFRNGVLDPQTGIMTAHCPDNKNVSVMGVDYNPAAECPTWDTFISDIFEEEPTRSDLLHEMLGWLICSDTLGIEKAILMHGSSRAGKGAIIEVLYRILGSGAVPVKMAQLAKDKPLSMMRNAVVAIDSDATTPRGPDAAVVHANFNAITANESVSVPLLFTQEPWHGPLNCKLLIACNDIPVIHDDSGAAPKRWLPLLFSKSFMDREDKTLKQRLIAEREGIATRIVAALQRLIANGGEFTLPQSTVDQMVALTHAASPVVEFLTDCATYDGEGKVHATTLYDAYRVWAVQTGNNSISRNRFTRSVKTATQPHGVTHSKSVRIGDDVRAGFEGLCLKSCDIGVRSNVTPITRALADAPPPPAPYRKA